ncbi:MAG: diphthine--ammonia ligase [Nitrososphaerota archaeon]|nr:diphthine--ammonia ligase [Candidatus Bathyarchaeota archaeon]MDW8022534.1 diphthine--ammonia ligase [Nitrososphaerota archaeon]
MVRAVVSWSGGKDSCFAYYKAILNGFKVVCLLNIISKENRVMSHGLDSKLVAAQSEAIGIPIVQRETTWDTYEKNFKEVMSELKREMRVEYAIFGDIHVQEHLDWVNRVCREVGIVPVEPLWRLDCETILTDFIDAGFEAILVNVRADIFGKEWLGRKIDRSLIEDFKKLQESCNFDLCGEFGEYHTLVVDGPIFVKRLKILESEKMLKEGYWKCWLLDISKYVLEGKNGDDEEKVRCNPIL